MAPFKSFLITTGLITTLFLLLIAVFNALANPFDFFRLLTINDFNQQKTEVQTHERMTKAHRVRLQQPEIIILGSSRAEFGLNPEHPGFPATKKKRYNLALHSANIYEVLRYLQHAQSIHPLTQVVIGLDFYMFNNNKKNEADFEESRLAPEITGWLQDITRSLITYDGVLASINTIRNQNNKYNIEYFPNGFRNDSNNWARIQRKGGHHQATVDTEKYTLFSRDGFIFFTLSSNGDKIQSLDIFKKILLFCKSNSIDLKLFISPIHTRKLQILYQIGLWKEFENWKYKLVKILENNTPEYYLWDFTGYNEITTEPFPPPGDNRTEMKWYWESSHYKKETGDLILNKILNYKPNNLETITFNFGIKLTPSNINEHLEKIRLEHAIFQKKHPELVSEINQMLSDTKEKRRKTLHQYPNLKPLNYFKDISKLPKDY